MKADDPRLALLKPVTKSPDAPLRRTGVTVAEPGDMRRTSAFILVLAAIALPAGCFSPSYRDCQLTCRGNDACPDGFSCHAGFCRAEDEPTERCEVLVVDGSVWPELLDAGRGVADAHIAPPAHDAGGSTPSPSPPPGFDAAPGPTPPLADAAPPPPPPPTCDPNETPPEHSCGGPVLCAKKIEAQSIKARVIYAKEVHTNVLDAECVIENGDQDHYENGANDNEIQLAHVVVDVIYAKEVKADRVEADEIRAKEVKLDP